MDSKLGFAISGILLHLSTVLKEIRGLVEAGADIVPILSFNAAALDTRFQTAEDFRRELTAITGHEPLTTLAEVEPIGPKGCSTRWWWRPAPARRWDAWPTG